MQHGCAANGSYVSLTCCLNCYYVGKVRNYEKLHA
jgi:hypothetical protein